MNKYNQKTRAESNREVSLQNEVNEFWKAVYFNKVITHIRETYVRGIDFEANALIKLYERLLEENNVKYILLILLISQRTFSVLYQNQRKEE